jgi:hypothetical protein
MPRGQGHEHTKKAKRMAKHIEESGKERYGDRAEEVAWRTVHSELPKSEREKESEK